MTKSNSFHFIEVLRDTLREEKLIPMWGHPPAFPWDAVSKSCTQIFGQDAQIKTGASQWMESDKLLSGLGADPRIISLELSPLTEPVFIACPRTDIAKLIAALTKESGPGLDDPEISTAYFEYMLVKLLSEIADIKPLEDLTPQLADHAFKPTRSYTCDFSLVLGAKTHWMRLICPDSFHSAFRAHFLNHPLDLSNHPETVVPLAFEVGSTTLSAAKWQEVQVGDFVILDHCSYYINDHKGSMLLSCGSKPLFQLRSKEGEVKILDYAYTFEETTMDEDEEFIEDRVDEEEESPPATHTEHQDLISADNVPLQITVEVCRMHMPLAKVLTLKPGNTLELSQRPEEGITLCVSGKAIAKGQLIQVGDVLGVKITDVG
ncbi:MAG: type III secretion system cytoplasmic ring protein SctQ [Chlamydiales bacterium]|nr:type III secretion system cytoplasmic ring protein SctQ [Chlamydiales bacterium]